MFNYYTIFQEIMHMASNIYQVFFPSRMLVLISSTYNNCSYTAVLMIHLFCLSSGTAFITWVWLLPYLYVIIKDRQGQAYPNLCIWY